MTLFAKKTGRRFVASKAYEIVDRSSSSVIRADAWSSTIQPDMELEMGIVLRQLLSLLEGPVTCPWCRADTMRSEVGEREWASWYVISERNPTRAQIQILAWAAVGPLKSLRPTKR
jgi:hypothetical protein